MIAKVIGGLVVLAIVGYFLISLGGKAEQATKSDAVHQLQKQISDQRSQLEGLGDDFGAPPMPEPAAASEAEPEIPGTAQE